MSEMVERVARAMYDVWYPHGLPRWGEAVISKETWRASARAAIAAMREPTDWMIDRMTPELMIAENAWRAGIDAALGETAR